MKTGKNMTETFDYLMDTSGLFCPEPVMMLHTKVNECLQGEIIKVVATDPSTKRDIPKFCHFLGHKLLRNEDVDGHYIYYIEIQNIN
jgi:tRNA 2-thiouridine synthesizing protein A